VLNMYILYTQVGVICQVNENPNSQDFFKNTQALRVVNGVCNNIKGNCRGNKDITTIEQMPLPKRIRKHV